MRKNIFLLILVQCYFSYTLAQVSYWQQQTDYKIQVTLDDVNHFLRGHIEITYHNNSPNELKELYIHLFPNAYAGRKTVYNQELLKHGDTKFHFADENDYGFIDSLNFILVKSGAQTEERSVTLAYPNPDSRDVALIYLEQPIKSGETFKLKSSFREKLPYSFSRGGHYGQAYQITQWFPKMAMYDKDGWHPRHYTEQAEYYDNFGDYDVTITLPANYIVAATGNLTTHSELEWLQSLIGKEKDFSETPASSKEWKTINYMQKNVHDFAWFADKQFMVSKSSVILPKSKRNVDTWAFYLPQHKEVWKNAARMIDSSIYYYSLWVGDYLYSQCTAVDGHLLAGGGMEYPNITIIAGSYKSEKSLESVIAHEVGHNWFQGMLGTNEADYPWLDEGFNTYYQQRYMAKRYPSQPKPEKKGFSLSFQFDLDDSDNFRDATLLTYMHRRHDDQPVCFNANAFTTMNYGLMVYMKAPFLIRYLEKYLGTANFDQSMQHLFAQWKLKHPSPQDFQQAFKETVPQDLDWFFTTLICSTEKMDYKIVSSRDTTNIGGKVYRKIVVKNLRKNKVPFSISALNEDSTIQKQWYGGFTGKNNLLFPAGNYRLLALDADFESVELHRQNNYYRTRGVLRKTEPFQVKLIGGIENPKRTTLYVAPAFGYNYYNKFMYGVVFHNGIFPCKNVEWQIIPLYARQSGNVNGFARLNTYIFPKANSINITKINFNLTATRFAYAARRDAENTDYFDEIHRVQGALRFYFKTDWPTKQNSLTLRNIYMQGKEYLYDYDVNTQKLVNFRPNYYHNNYIQLIYEFSDSRKLNPYSIRIVNESGFFMEDKFTLQYNYISRLTAEVNYRLHYNKKKGLDVRVFGGFDPTNQQPLFLAGGNGANDYTADHYFLGRFERDGLAAHQMSLSGGMMKFNTLSYAGRLGEGYSALALNLKSSLPIPLIFAFADVGIYNPLRPSFNLSSLLFDAGLGIKIIPDVFEIYLPLLVSSDISNNIYTQPNYNIWYKRVMFTIELQKLDPYRWIRNFNM